MASLAYLVKILIAAQIFERTAAQRNEIHFMAGRLYLVYAV
jgi:uncharacterized membrane protein